MVSSFAEMDVAGKLYAKQKIGEVTDRMNRQQQKTKQTHERMRGCCPRGKAGEVGQSLIQVVSVTHSQTTDY